MEEKVINIRLEEKDDENERKSVGFEEFIDKNKYFFPLLIIKILFVGIGLVGFKFFDFFTDQPKIEILGEETGSGKIEAETGLQELETRKIVVEIAGEVLTPGVYELNLGSRVNDLLVSSGGLAINADRVWVAKNVNLAQKLQDGNKIYVPKVGSKVSEIGSISDISEKININTASKKELDSLWGVGEATAKKIIDGRPYQDPKELLKKKVINSNVWEKIKEALTVY